MQPNIFDNQNMSNNEKNDQHLLEHNHVVRELETKVYFKRWIILLIFCLYSSVNAYQWIEYSSITNIVVRYYNVSSVAVDWTSIIYMALYPFLVIPASYIITAKGLRMAGLVGCLGTALGTTIKVFSIGRDLFYVVMIGQSIVSASQTLILCLPPKVAAVWFKPSEISTACALGVFGVQLGCAIGFILSPIIVKNHDNPEDIGADLRVMCWGLALSIVPLVIAVLVYFPRHPKLPPSNTQAEERNNKQDFSTRQFFKSIHQLFSNKGFLIHALAYSINVGVFSGIGPLLSQFIIAYFPHAQEDAGRMGFVLTVVGMVGSVLFGVILDKTHKFKEISLLVYLGSTISVLMLMFSLEMKSKLLAYISCGVVGMFTNGYMPVGFEFAIELTFPSEESTTAGILVSLTQICGVAFAVGLGYLNMFVGPFWALSSQVVLLLVGTVVTYFTPNELRRQAAFKQTTYGQNLVQFAALAQDEKKIDVSLG